MSKTKTTTVALELVSDALSNGRAESRDCGTSRSFNDREAADHIREAFHAAQNAFGHALRKVVVCGLIMLDVREHLPHGEFGPWLRKNAFDELSDTEFDSAWRNARRWMDTAHGLREGLQIGQNVRFDDLPLHVVLQLESCDLSKEQRAIQSKVFDFLEGKTQKQLQLEWRNADPTPPGGFRPARTELNDWLEAHGYSHLRNQPFASLPPKLQNAFRKDTQAQPKLADPKKQSDAQESAARELLDDALRANARTRSHAVAALLKRADHAELIASCVETANFYRALSSTASPRSSRGHEAHSKKKGSKE